MKWQKIESLEELQRVKMMSTENTVLIFKHSTTCSISRMALSRLERNWNVEEMDQIGLYYLDLLRHRDVSNQIAEEFAVPHESPQILLIEDGLSIYDRSHFDIDYQDLVTVAKRSKN